MIVDVAGYAHNLGTVGVVFKVVILFVYSRCGVYPVFIFSVCWGGGGGGGGGGECCAEMKLYMNAV